MPVARRMPREWLPKSIKQRLEEETYLLNVTFKTFLTILRIVYRRHSTKLQDGMTAPNPKVETFDKKTVHLLDFVKQNRPLVVNFGSCTWPPFMSKLAQFNSLVADFDDAFDFVTVYVSEAHANDDWNLIGNQYDIANHVVLEDRISAARQLQAAGVKCPIVVDTMTNDAQKAYKSLPEALYVIEDGQIVYQALGPYAYKPSELRTWMDLRKERLSKKMW